MSYKITEIDGDMTVGRDIYAGGKMNVRGSMTVGHTMKVDGWLDAPNVKGGNKGLFLTEEALKEAYPKPEAGWYAGVGTGTPFAGYVVENGEWVLSGGTIEIDPDTTALLEEMDEKVDLAQAYAEGSPDITGAKQYAEEAGEKAQEADSYARNSADSASDSATSMRKAQAYAEGSPDITGAKQYAEEAETARDEAAGSAAAAANTAERIHSSLEEIDTLKKNMGYYECTTEGATADKVVSGVRYTLPIKAPYGGSIKVRFAHANSAASPTLSIGDAAAKPLYYDGAPASESNTWADGETVEVYYDGTNFQANNVAGGGKFKSGQRLKDISIIPLGGDEIIPISQLSLLEGALLDTSVYKIKAPSNPSLRMFVSKNISAYNAKYLSIKTSGDISASVFLFNVDYSGTTQSDLPRNVPSDTLISSSNSWETEYIIEIPNGAICVGFNVMKGDGKISISSSDITDSTFVVKLLSSEAEQKNDSLYSKGSVDKLIIPISKSIEKINETLYAQESEQITTSYENGQYRGQDGSYMTSSKRVVTDKINIEDTDKVVITVDAAYNYNITLFDSAGVFVRQISSSWITDRVYTLENLSGKFAIHFSDASNPSTVDIPADTFNGLTMVRYLADGGIVEIVNRLNEEVEELKPKTYDHIYTGELIDLRNRAYNLKKIINLTAPTSYNGAQSLAIKDNTLIIGRALETSRKTDYLVYVDGAFTANLLLQHTGYSAIHSNTICFGEDSQHNLPLLYTSQWDGQRACFVYEIDNSYNATLVRVIDPANLSASKFGAGAADWIVGDGYLYSIAYILNSPYPGDGNGLRVCKFALPTGNGVINLADSDIIESYDIEPCFIRQDSHYHNGKIYTLFGGGSVYQEYRRMQVLDVVKKAVVSIADMTYLESEPEAISMYNGGLVMMLNGVSNGVWKFIFN